MQRQWLDILEDTKKNKAARDKQKKEAALRLVEQQKETTAANDKNVPKESVDSSNRKNLSRVMKKTVFGVSNQV